MLVNLFWVSFLFYIFIIAFTAYYIFNFIFMPNQQGSKLKLKQKLD